jgi:tetratricopeptide (TPR) repeat protein
MSLPDTPGRDLFKAWLHRPFLDLGPAAPESPFQVLALEFDYRSLVEDEPLPRLQISLNPSYREAVVAATGLSQYQLTSPVELPRALWTDRWAVLSEHVEAFPELPRSTQVRVGWLLAKLCLFDVILELVPADAVERVSASDDHASLAYLRAWARFKKWLDNDCDGFSPREFEPIALDAPPGMARIDGAYEMVRQNAKHTGDVAACERWQRVHSEAIGEAREQFDEFTTGLMMSRYYRVGGFIPQMHKDRAGVEADMSEAVEIARALSRHDHVHRIAADEMLYAALESRMKEAMWLGDLDLALERADEYLGLAPRSAKGWTHRADVLLERDETAKALECYRQAARLAPPGEEEALFMAGHCCERRDDLEGALDAYLGALRVDPLGISAAERLEHVAARLAHMPVLDWTRSHLAELRSLTPKPSWPDPYRHLLPPETEPAKPTATPAT